MCLEGNGCRQSVLDSTWGRCELVVFCYTRDGYSCNTGQQPRQMQESELPIGPELEVSRFSTMCCQHNQLYAQITIIVPRVE